MSLGCIHFSKYQTHCKCNDQIRKALAPSVSLTFRAEEHLVKGSADIHHSACKSNYTGVVENKK